jgi:HSP20 family molecular chaperone IbpA
MDAENLSANFENGLWKIKISKREKQKGRTIDIK